MAADEPDWDPNQLHSGLYKDHFLAERQEGIEREGLRSDSVRKRDRKRFGERKRERKKERKGQEEIGKDDKE